VPAGFSLADGAEAWLGPKFGRVLANDSHIGTGAGVAHPAE
jgi:hypothetical protein